MDTEKITVEEGFRKLYARYGFTERPRQIVMANYLAAPLYYRNVEGSPYTTAVVEGGTGIGKTMAYLMPVVLAQKGLLADALVPDDVGYIKNLSTLIPDNAKNVLAGEPEIEGKIVSPIKPGAKIFVSTSSKLLQGQLMEKDLKMLQEFLHEEFNESLRYVKVEGTSNYICGKKVEKFIDKSEEAIDAGAPLLKDTLDLLEVAKRIHASRAQTMDDVRNAVKDLEPEILEALLEGENPFSPGHDTHNCSECVSKCKFFELMEEIKKADVVVMNHHWFAHNIFRSAYMHEKAVEHAAKVAAAAGEPSPPPFKGRIPDSIGILNNRPVMIFDEAHDLEQALIKALSNEISLKRYHKHIKNLQKNLDELSGAMSGTLTEYAGALQGMDERLETAREYQRQCIKDKKEPDTAECWKPVYEQASVLQGLGGRLDATFGDNERMTTLGDMQTAFLWKVDPTWNRLRNTTKNLNNMFDKVFDKDGLTFNIFDQHSNHLALMPITAGYMLRGWKRWQNMTKAFCSATLATTKGSNPFQFFLRRVGVHNETVLSAIAALPFEYGKNTMLFLPDMPNPVKEKEEWQQKVVESVGPLVNITKGGSLFLFTSREHMRDVYAKVADDLRAQGYRTGIQGVGSVQSLREMFDTYDNAVIFGVESFWQGLDVPGNGLRNLVIVRLPFDNPDDAFIKGNVKAEVERRMRVVPDLTEQGAQRQVFYQFQFPRTILALKQGLGRLIRKMDDKGMWVILDPRFLKAPYSGKLMDVLVKDIPVTTSWERAEERADELGLKLGQAASAPQVVPPPPLVAVSSSRRASAVAMGM